MVEDRFTATTRGTTKHPLLPTEVFGGCKTPVIAETRKGFEMADTKNASDKNDEPIVVKREQTSVDPFGISALFGYTHDTTTVEGPNGKYSATEYGREAADKAAGDGYREGKRD